MSSTIIRRYFVEITVIAAVFVIILGVSTARYLNALELTQQKKEELILNQLKTQESQIAQAQLAIDLLVAENKAVGERIKEETDRRLASEAVRKSDELRAQQKIAELEKNLQTQTPNLAAIIQEWRPRIASIRCEWERTLEGTLISSGSGVLFNSAGTPVLFTSRHILLSDDELPASCAIKFPGTDTSYTVSKSAISYAKNEDFARIDLSAHLTAVLSRMAPFTTRCSSEGTSGDTIIILGYPSIGSKTDITATEGIISGYDSPHYITSAKVERGNSGGAAILARENCYLGIPTFVGLGRIEALARILDQKTLP